MAYVCKEPGCVESVEWHLQHGDFDCIADNKEAVRAYAASMAALKADVAALGTETTAALARAEEAN